MTELIEKQLDNQATTRGIPKVGHPLKPRPSLLLYQLAACCAQRSGAVFGRFFVATRAWRPEIWVAPPAWHVPAGAPPHPTSPQPALHPRTPPNSRFPVQEKVITDVLLLDQPIKRFVRPEEVRRRRREGWGCGR